MSVKENLIIPNQMAEKMVEIKKYSKNYQNVIKKRKEIDLNNASIKSNSNPFSSNYDNQVKHNEKSSAIISILIRSLFIIAGLVTIFLLFKNTFEMMNLALGEFNAVETGIKALAPKFENLFLLFHIFALAGMVGMVFYGVWLILIDNDDHEGLATLLCALWILLKVANLVLGIVCVIKLMTIENTELYFQSSLWSFIKTAGIGLGIHLLFLVLFPLFGRETMKSMVDKFTLKKAKKRDEVSFARNKKTYHSELKQKNENLEREISELFNLYPSEKVKKVIDELEDISPIYCDFYNMKGNEVCINKSKLDSFDSKLTACIEMIKSGRASSIKEALNEIEKDKVASENESLIRQRNAQLYELNEKIDSLQDDYYYDDYSDY